MATPFLLWSKLLTEGQWCKTTVPSPVTDDYEISFGHSVIERWENHVTIPMDPAFPKDLELADSLYHNAPSARLVSNRLREFLLAQRVTHTEFLPVGILNHKGRVAADDYWFAHPTPPLDCIDLEASNAEFDSDDLNFWQCDSLVIRPEAVPEDILLFRPQFQTGLILVRESLAQAMEAEGFTGLSFRDPAKYFGI